MRINCSCSWFLVVALIISGFLFLRQYQQAEARRVQQEHEWHAETLKIKTLRNAVYNNRTWAEVLKSASDLCALRQAWQNASELLEKAAVLNGSVEGRNQLQKLGIDASDVRQRLSEIDLLCHTVGSRLVPVASEVSCVIDVEGELKNVRLYRDNGRLREYHIIYRR